MDCTASNCARPSTHDSDIGRLCQHHFMAWRRYGYLGSAYPTTCTVDGCAARHASGGFCSKHYKLMRETGSTNDRPSRRRQRHTCTIDECDLAVMGHGLCSKHYTRMRRYGTTDEPTKPTLHPTLCCICGGNRPTRRSKYCSDVCFEHAMFYARREQGRTKQLQLYGLTVADYDAILDTQDGKCAICGSTDPKGKRGNFSVDHCHESGRVRGLLCTPCNAGIGQLGDSIDRLAVAIEYLRRTE